ncbi:MAG: 6-phosphofructokinase [Caldilineaceae bacterium]|nr:6-phosphofructokinase [Caldilineaceae bacterium]
MKKRIGVLTSGGDAPGMNAAVRAVVRGGLSSGAEMFAIYEGYSGMIDGGNSVRTMDWSSVGGILHRGGTVIGSARSDAFRTVEGRRRAVRNLLEHDIDALVVIGGDGSLTGANVLRQEWSDHLVALLEAGEITPQQAEDHAYLTIAGIVGSIDNDMWGTDMTIGADTALHRIIAATDAISSTAASHQRAFVLEVMGRHAGYLALMSALASGADFAFIPESPPDVPDWRATLCEILSDGRKEGRRDSMVIVAEGAVDREGNPITAEDVRSAIAEGLNEDVRITVLGHVQRGGSPSAFDRILSTRMGVAAVRTIMEATPEDEPMLIGISSNRIVRRGLMECVNHNQEINAAINAHDFDKAMEMRGPGFQSAFRTLRTLVRAMPHEAPPNQRRLRIGIMNAGGPAPGMNAAIRAAVRLILDKGHVPIGIERGFRGLVYGEMRELKWMDVDGWAALGGSELGTSRKVPRENEYYTMARQLEDNKIDALLMVGGWAGYQSCINLYNERSVFKAFDIPIVCVPASINNNLPGADFSIGSDTALNSIADVVDKIKQSAVASNRCFVVEVMGGYCGYLALMSALASGAERAYLHEEGVTLSDLEKDIHFLNEGFRHGKRLGLIIRNEKSNPLYDTNFLAALFEQEGGDLFNVRMAVLGHLQQGGDPTPYDRNTATLLTASAIEIVVEACSASEEEPPAICLGLVDDRFTQTHLYQVSRIFDQEFERPKKQWWMRLRPLASMLAQPSQDSEGINYPEM